MSAGYGRPVLRERMNPERPTILLPLVKEPVSSDVGNGGNDVGNANGKAVTTEERVLHLVAGNPKISAQSIAGGLGMSKRHIERVMAGLRDEGILIREQAPRPASRRRAARTRSSRSCALRHWPHWQQRWPCCVRSAAIAPTMKPKAKRRRRIAKTNEPAIASRSPTQSERPADAGRSSV